MADQRENIIKKASELFHQAGIKSVSMDDICRELGMSKKTLYTYYAQKDDLVEATLSYFREQLSGKIEDFFSSSQTIWDHITCFTENSRKMPDVRRVPPLVYDLNKYYPAIAQRHNALVFDLNVNAMKRIIHKGKEEGIFRSELDEEMTAFLFARLHNSAIEDSVKCKDETLSMKRILNFAMDTLFRGILSENGLAKYNSILENESKESSVQTQ